MKYVFGALVVVLGLSGIAQAGPYTDEMSKCLVRSTSEGDRTLLIEWVYAAMSSHPDVQAMSRVSPQMKASLSKRTANLMMTLLTERCKTETEQAVKYEGKNSLRVSFEILGKVAMRGLMSDPNVAKYVGQLDNYVDEDKLKRMLHTQ